MDKQFISKMCTSYYNDMLFSTNKYQKDKIINEMENEINSLIASVKLEDIDLYYELFDFNRTQQYRLMYTLLEDYISDKYGLDVESTEINEEVSTILLGSIAIAAATLIGMKQVTNAFNTTVTALAKLNDSIYKKLSKLSAPHKIYGAIIRSDQENCMRKCNINGEKDLDKWTLFYTLTGQTMNKESMTQADCLIACYLDTSCECAEQLAKSYKQCMDITGNHNTDSISTILNIPIEGQCKPFHETLLKHNAEFNKTVELIFKKPSEKDNYIRQYNNAINNGLKGNSKFQRPNDFPQKSTPSSNTGFIKKSYNSSSNAQYSSPPGRKY